MVKAVTLTPRRNVQTFKLKPEKLPPGLSQAQAEQRIAECMEEAIQRVHYGQVFVPPPNTLEEYLR